MTYLPKTKERREKSATIDRLKVKKLYYELMPVNKIANKMGKKIGWVYKQLKILDVKKEN